MGSAWLLVTQRKRQRFLAYVNGIAWSPNSAYVATASDDKKVHIWNAGDARSLLIYTGHQKAVRAVSWSPDGERIASAEEQTVLVWNYKSGELLTRLEHKKGFLLSLESVAWSPDGARIVSGSSDGTLHVWAAETGSYRVICRGHTKTVKAVAFSPDGGRVASVSDDGTARVWDSQSGQQLFVYDGHIPKVQVAPDGKVPAVKVPNLRALAWSPDGRYIASGGTDQIVHV